MSTSNKGQMPVEQRAQAMADSSVWGASDFYETLNYRTRIMLMLAVALTAFWLTYMISDHGIFYFCIMIATLLQLRTAQVVWGFANIAMFCLFRYADSMSNQPGGFFFDIVFVILVMAYLSLSCRYFQTCKYAFAYDIDQRNSEQSPSLNFSILPIFSSGWHFGIAAMLWAAMLLILVYLDPNAPNWNGLKPVWSRLAGLSFVLFFGWYFLRVLFGLFWRWQQPGEVADIEIRALANSEVFYDLAGVERRLAKLVKKGTISS